MCAGNTHPWETHIPVTPVSVFKLKSSARVVADGYKGFRDKQRTG